MTPLTQTADVAVKSAMSGVVDAPSAAATGSMSRTVPAATSAAKPRTRTSAGAGGRRMRFGAATR